jgi:hypothetical protein
MSGALVRRAALAGACLAAMTAAAALVVHVTAAEDVRQDLAFSFRGVPDELDEASAILVTNARIAGVFLLAAALRGVPRHEARQGALYTLAGAACDTLVALTCVANAAFVGAAIGAYGRRMLEAMLPHGPIELAGFALALGTYLQARHQVIVPGALVRIVGAVISLLGAAAAAETYA